jgi:hypothetical protein
MLVKYCEIQVGEATGHRDRFQVAAGWCREVLRGGEHQSVATLEGSLDAGRQPVAAGLEVPVLTKEL